MSSQYCSLLPKTIFSTGSHAFKMVQRCLIYSKVWFNSTAHVIRHTSFSKMHDSLMKRTKTYILKTIWIMMARIQTVIFRSAFCCQHFGYSLFHAQDGRFKSQKCSFNLNIWSYPKFAAKRVFDRNLKR